MSSFAPVTVLKPSLYIEICRILITAKLSELLVIYYWGETLKIEFLVSFLLFM